MLEEEVREAVISTAGTAAGELLPAAPASCTHAGRLPACPGMFPPGVRSDGRLTLRLSIWVEPFAPLVALPAGAGAFGVLMTTVLPTTVEDLLALSLAAMVS